MRVLQMLALLLSAWPAQAHDFYDKTCCGGHDCRPVPCETIRAEPGGFDFTDPLDRASYFFSRDKMKPSQDGQCHVCIYRSVSPPTPQCLYLPISTRRHTQIWLVADYAVHLIILHGPDGQIVALNPMEVTSVRDTRAEFRDHFHKSTRCLVFTADGKFIGVTEDCASVRTLIENGDRE